MKILVVFLYVFDLSIILNKMIFTFGCDLLGIEIGLSFDSIAFTGEGKGALLDNSSLHNSISDASKDSIELLINDKFH